MLSLRLAGMFLAASPITSKLRITHPNYGLYQNLLKDIEEVYSRMGRLRSLEYLAEKVLLLV